MSLKRLVFCALATYHARIIHSLALNSDQHFVFSDQGRQKCISDLFPTS
jgi:hypothetical protein